ncbi:hypothetical protein EON76_06245 [bacterium]|nr:MAG: hypothetical protein EON76_06245 [bacterium]
MVVLLALFYTALVLAVYYGYVIPAVIAAWIASPVIFLAHALAYERGECGRGITVREVFSSVFSPRRQAWSFLFGDLILLPGVFGVTAHAWSQHPVESFSTGWLAWLFVSLVLGCVAGIVFHFVIDKPAYEEAGHAASLNSPTKWIHDFVTYPSLFGALLFAVPAIVPDIGLDWHTIVVMELLATWGLLGVVVDGRRGKTLVPWGHPAFDLERGEVIWHTLR